MGKFNGNAKETERVTLELCCWQMKYIVKDQSQIAIREDNVPTQMQTLLIV